MKLSRRRFMTTDKKGCQFEAELFRVREWSKGPILEQHYYGMGIKANSLEELKIKVSQIER